MFRCRAKREQLKRFQGISFERQGHNLALTVLYVPNALDSGHPKVHSSPCPLAGCRHCHGRGGSPRERAFFIHNLLVRLHFIIVMMRWTGLTPLDFDFFFPGSLTSTFLKVRRRGGKRDDLPYRGTSLISEIPQYGPRHRPTVGS